MLSTAVIKVKGALNQILRNSEMHVTFSMEILPWVVSFQTTYQFFSFFFLFTQHCISMRETPFSEKNEALTNASVIHWPMAFGQLILSEVECHFSRIFFSRRLLKKKPTVDPPPVKTA